MEVVGPDAVQAPAAGRLGAEHAGQVAVVLGDQVDRAVGTMLADPGRQLGQEVARALVHHRVGRVEPQAVHVVLVDPVQGVLDEERADHLAAGTIQVDRGTPGRPVPVGQIGGAEAGQVAAVGAEVVVDDVEQHGHPQAVGTVHQGAQVVGRAVASGRGEEVHAVIAPVAPAGEVGDRHQLDGGDPQPGQLGQPGGGPGECPLGREGPDVQLVDDQVVAGNSLPGPSRTTRTSRDRRSGTGRGRLRAGIATPGPGTVLRHRGDSRRGRPAGSRRTRRGTCRRGIAPARATERGDRRPTRRLPRSTSPGAQTRKWMRSASGQAPRDGFQLIGRSAS